MHWYLIYMNGPVYNRLEFDILYSCDDTKTDIMNIKASVWA